MLLLVSVVVIAVCFVMVGPLRGGPQHLHDWMLGGMAIGVSILLLVLRGRIPDPLSILGGNIGIACGYLLLGMGTSRLFREPTPWGLIWIGIGLSTLFLVVYLLGGTLEHRTLVASAMIGIFACVLLLQFWPRRHGRWRTGARVAIAALSVLMIGSTVRFLLVLFMDDAITLQPEALTIGVVTTTGLSVALAACSVLVTMRRRVRAAAASRGPQENEPPADAGERNWQLVRERRMLVSPQGNEIRLTGSEFVVMQMLVEGGEEPVSRQALNALIGRDNPKDRGIDILISRLRRKCDGEGDQLPVVSVRGRGYVMHGSTQSVAGRQLQSEKQ